MKPIRIFTHVACEPPGYLQTLLDRLGLAWEQVCLYDGQRAPDWDDGASALVFMGGPGDVNEPSDWMKSEMDLIRAAHEGGIPMLGICLGAQLMSKALGGRVWPGEDLEVGWRTVELLPAGERHAWFDGLESGFPVFQWHAHNFDPPPGATRLAENDCAPCQAWALENHLALQFHLEMTDGIIRNLLDKYASDLDRPSPCVQARGDILEHIEERCESVFRVADSLLVNWFRSLPSNL